MLHYTSLFFLQYYMHVDDITAHTAQLALLQIIVVFESVIPTDPGLNVISG